MVKEHTVTQANSQAIADLTPAQEALQHSGMSICDTFGTHNVEDALATMVEDAMLMTFR